ncbi:amidohydrolase family protein [Actinomadura fulvescens]|uniref:Amidohydrolase family protein n=1 Tax=Actinomadura fulvescens TaxID=46160 RepID=A0ABN3Q2B7_9ACTN
MTETVIVAEHVWDGLTPEPRRHTEIVVRDGRVVACQDRADRAAQAQVLELGDVTLLPGLIDCHVHTVSGAGSSSQAALRALPALRALLDNGFTTVRDLGCFPPEPVNLELRQAVDSGLIPGPRLIVAPRIISGRGGHGDQTSDTSGCECEVGALADGSDQIIRLVREQVRLRADWIKFAATGGFATSVDDPSAIGYHEAEMRALVTTARDHGLPVACHAMGDDGVRRAALAGVTTMEHGLLASESTLQLLANRHIPLVPTQYSATVFVNKLEDDGFWADKPDNVRRQVERHAEDLRTALKRQVRSNAQLVFGTDAGTVDHADNWREFPTLVASGLSPYKALQAATSVAARVLGRDDIGCIKPGARADLVAVPGDPFLDIDVLGHVNFVMKDGIVHRHPDSA